MLAARGSSQSLLPELKPNGSAEYKKALVPAPQPDYIPDELLFALTQPPPVSDSLGPPGRQRNLAVTNVPYRKNAANMWSYPKRREKFKHLTENTPCLCGAGKDISFLYDVPKSENAEEISTARDKSAVRVLDSQEKKHTMALPDTLIPKEYFVVKNKGVLGLEYHDDKYALQPVDHEKHLVVFPSMKPTSRYEVLQLKKTMERMLEELEIEAGQIADMQGPTQMHNLMDLIKKEQNIYNIIFHEIIRQVSVECVERGELLADLRDRYSGLFNQVPVQVKSIHEEVLAQRALDRRLTDELMRFKTTISSLTNELSAVKAHDNIVTKEAAAARTDLKNALAESQKSTGLLTEYHDLYELQRKRLEQMVLNLLDEKELWSTAAYSLALKVTEEHSLNTARRLHVSEKAWVKLATHFTIMLNDKDTEGLTKLQEFVDQWRDIIEEFDVSLQQREEAIKEQIRRVQQGLRKWNTELTSLMLSREGFLVKTPGKEKTEELFQDLKSFEQTLMSQSQKLGGDTMLKGQEQLLQIRRMMEGWTDAALQVFLRHKAENGVNSPDQEDMGVMNEEVDELLSQYQIRLTGENGSASSLIRLSSAIEGWESKFNPFTSGSRPIAEQEWLRFLKALGSWDTGLDATYELVSRTQREEDRAEGKPHTPIELPAVVKHAQIWLDSTVNGIDSEDGKLKEQVTSLHTDMVKWMVQILLRLAPDLPNHSAQAKEAVLLGSTTLGELQTNAKSLFVNLEVFSKFVTRCCTGIVVQMAQEKRDRHEENADSEYKDLMKLKVECDTWIQTAKLLLHELTGDPLLELTPKSSTMSLSPSKLTDTMLSLETHKEEEETDGQTEKEEERDEEESHEIDKPMDVPEEEKKAKPEDDEDNKELDEIADSQATPSGVDLVKRQGTPSLPSSTPQQSVTPPGETIQILGSDAYTHTAKIHHTTIAPPQDPKDRPMSQRTQSRDNTPNTKRAYEGLATIDTLQTQLIAAEERAQVAEGHSFEMEAKLKEAEERIAALEKKIARLPEQTESVTNPETTGSNHELKEAASKQADGQSSTNLKETQSDSKADPKSDPKSEVSQSPAPKATSSSPSLSKVSLPATPKSGSKSPEKKSSRKSAKKKSSN